MGDAGDATRERGWSSGVLKRIVADDCGGVIWVLKPLPAPVRQPLKIEEEEAPRPNDSVRLLCLC